MNIGKETEQIEFKTSLAEQKQGFESISSILNKHKKGFLYFGVLDNGEVKGLQIGKDTLNHVSRDLELYIKPSFMHTIKAVVSDEGQEFIEIQFSGDNGPYSAYGRYFMRFADRDVLMDQDMLMNFFESKKRTYESWENADSGCSINDVSDDYLKEYIQRGNECGRIKFIYDEKLKVLRKLGLIFSDDNLNNAGNVLLSSKKPITVKFATFASEKRVTILDMNVFNGNVFECIDASMRYIKEHINWDIVFNGEIKSKEIPEIPLVALREIVVNAFAHGSYESISTEFEINVYKDRVVIYSPGHFPKPFTPEQFAFEGQEPIPLNNKICSVLYNDETIEKHSTGFERTFESCKKENVKYDYLDTGLGFRFTFYRKNVHGHVQLKITENDNVIIERLKDNPSMTIAELAKFLKVSDKTVYRALNKLKILGIVVRRGNDKDGYWEILGK